MVEHNSIGASDAFVIVTTAATMFGFGWSRTSFIIQMSFLIGHCWERPKRNRKTEIRSSLCGSLSHFLLAPLAVGLFTVILFVGFSYIFHTFHFLLRVIYFFLSLYTYILRGFGFSSGVYFSHLPPAPLWSCLPFQHGNHHPSPEQSGMCIKLTLMVLHRPIQHSEKAIAHPSGLTHYSSVLVESNTQQNLGTP